LERPFPQVAELHLSPFLPAPRTWDPAGNRFEFLNRSHAFGTDIDWSFPDFGKLWTYNLQYLECLLQPDMTPEAGCQLLHDFIRQLSRNPSALEPYPTSLRLIHCILFLSRHNIRDEVIDQSLYAQAYALADQPEYHLMGNHLLENGFGLLFAAFRYQDKQLLRQARGILTDQLKEQILPDGGHFERSPMYHQILLRRVLDGMNLVRSLPGFGDDLLAILESSGAAMLAWLHNMTFSGGQMSRMNDAVEGVAPEPVALEAYGTQLLRQIPVLPLGKSGYRRFNFPGYELLVDAGDIGPDYIPGHAHSDTLGFELYTDRRPFLVDTGISTYEKNGRRQYERSTAAHNTVQCNGVEQSEVWGGFRVARRAKGIILRDESHLLEATHSGYDRMGIRHIRRFECAPNEIMIHDRVEGNAHSVARFHFFPGLRIEAEADGWACGGIRITFEGAGSVEWEDYEYAIGFNRLAPGKRAVVVFQDTLITRLTLFH
jgi:hypothetical protein